MFILSTNIDKKIIRNRVFTCHLSPDWQQMAIKNTVSSDILSAFFDCKEHFRLRPIRSQCVIFFRAESLPLHLLTEDLDLNY